MRLRSDIFVAAYIRRRNGENAFAVVRRKGAEEAGAVFICIDRLDGTAALYGPAPQTAFEADAPDRLFQRLTPPGATPADVEARVQRELNFDSDLWLVDVEDPAGESRLDLVHI
ncbi:MAG: DUF1491 family protein [Methylocystis sp.]|nr:DUF1491 family protein [Methylocystis sp.]MCA3582774.1 DUF1491 family protein [Methylocystis sp.]MCA3588490.1 DUF1491 family protein [Methylocystis sp.]MCA3592071.1 DUF1491 family protein [Methylocystis sp.]